MFRLHLDQFLINPQGSGSENNSIISIILHNLLRFLLFLQGIKFLVVQIRKTGLQTCSDSRVVWSPRKWQLSGRRIMRELKVWQPRSLREPRYPHRASLSLQNGASVFSHHNRATNISHTQNLHYNEFIHENHNPLTILVHTYHFITFL